MYTWFDTWKDEDYVRSCGVKDSEAETWFSIVILELAALVILVTMMILGYLNKKTDSDSPKDNQEASANKSPVN